MKITLTPTNARKLKKLVKYWNARRKAAGTAIVMLEYELEDR